MATPAREAAKDAARRGKPGWASIHFFANPARFLRVARAVYPWAAGAALALIAAGLVLGLYVAPPDYQQGDAYRIIFVHVPAAWMSLLIYVVIALCSVASLVWRHPLADLVAKSSAPVGAAFTVITLLSGALWGQPMWGTWWVWDARLTSMLVLLFLYLGYIALHAAFDDPAKGARIAAILALVGAWSTCPSSSSRWTGGTRCTSRPRSRRSTHPRSTPPWWRRCS